MRVKHTTYTKREIMREISMAKHNIRQANRGVGRVTFGNWSITLNSPGFSRLLLPYTVMHNDGGVENSTYSIAI